MEGVVAADEDEASEDGGRDVIGVEARGPVEHQGRTGGDNLLAIVIWGGGNLLAMGRMGCR